MTIHKRYDTVPAQVLNEAGIPCVLSGLSLHSLWGERGHYMSAFTIDYVVPDALVEKASSALLEAKSTGGNIFTICTDPESCDQMPKSRRKMLPSAHFHTVSEDDRTVEIFSQSALMWTLPTLDETLLPPASLSLEEFYKTLPSNYTLASNIDIVPGPAGPRLQHTTGRYGTEEYPVVIPKPHVLMEILFHQYGRHLNEGHSSDAVEGIYCLEAAFRKGHWDAKLLPRPLQGFLPMNHRKEYTRRDWDRDLMIVLGYPQRVDGVIGR